MTESVTELLDSRSVKLAGRTAFVLSAGGFIVNQISQMEFIQPWVVIATGLLSIIYLIMRIVMIRITFIEKQEERASAKKRRIKFLPSLFTRWKNWSSKK